MKNQSKRMGFSLMKLSALIAVFMTLLVFPQNSFAHCDSYDGPVIQDALKALESGQVELVFKWISAEQEGEVARVFEKALQYKKDAEVYPLLEKHFLETLVRLHREGEGAPYTGLKPAGTTAQIITLTDTAMLEKDLPGLLSKLNTHIEKVVKEKYDKLVRLYEVKDESPEKGRAFVAAYVDYTHTVEAIHAPLEHSEAPHSGTASHSHSTPAHQH